MRDNEKKKLTRMAYHWRHRDRLIAEHRAYRLAHRDEINEAVRERRSQHKDEINARRREIRKLDPVFRQKDRDRSRAYGAAHREYKRMKAEEWRKANPEKNYLSSLKCRFKRRYGITLDDYESLVRRQNGVCAICKKPQEGKKRKQLAVDHDHETGRVRALLCYKCNVTLGLCAEDISILKSMIAYLETHALWRGIKKIVSKVE